MIDYVAKVQCHDEDPESDEMVELPPGIDTHTYKGEIKKAILEGRLSKRQGKRLRSLVERLQGKLLETWAAGKDIEKWLDEVQTDAEVSISDGKTEINVFGVQSKGDPSLIGDGQWLRVRNGITMDSGCSVFVIPSDWLKMFPMTESEGSRRKQTYTAAAKGGQPIVNEGQKTIDFITDAGKRKKMVCQVADVNKILASVALICDKGNHVLFRSDGGDIINLKTGVKTPFRRHGNVYVLDAWVRNPAWKGEATPDSPSPELLGFTRQGGR